MLLVYFRRRFHPVIAGAKQPRCNALGRDMEMVKKRRILLLVSEGLNSEVAATVSAHNRLDRRLSWKSS